MKTTPFRKNFTINLERVRFLSNVPHALGTLDMSMGYTWPVNKKLGCMHCITFHVISQWFVVMHSSLL